MFTPKGSINLTQLTLIKYYIKNNISPLKIPNNFQKSHYKNLRFYTKSYIILKKQTTIKHQKMSVKIGELSDSLISFYPVFILSTNKNWSSEVSDTNKLFAILNSYKMEHKGCANKQRQN